MVESIEDFKEDESAEVLDVESWSEIADVVGQSLACLQLLLVELEPYQETGDLNPLHTLRRLLRYVDAAGRASLKRKGGSDA